MINKKNSFESLMAAFKALADESRVRAFCALRHQELCVCQITELLGLAPSTVSKHISILRQAGLVETRKDGRWIYYRIRQKNLDPDMKEFIEHVLCLLSNDEQIQTDDEQLQLILAMDPEEICKRQCPK